MKEFTLTVVYEPVDEGWVQARIAELPAVITVGHDHDEARSFLVVDALREYLLANAAQLAATPGEEREELTVLLRTAG